ncbi:MAG: RluA family pseudouridine synthase [Clostridia bacterium]|nr:RluA family pseudouridine synthase [Clostridia bacterium]
MREFLLTVTEDLKGKDIKYILKNRFAFSGRLITSLKEGDGITLNGKKEFVNKTVSSGDVLKITLFDKASENITPENIPLEILFEDEDLLIINKPPKMPTHTSVYHNTGTVSNAILYYFRDRPFTFRAPSRLDRDTSGVLIIAKNAWSGDCISRAIKNGEFEKEYVAVCVGTLKGKKGTVSAPIKREKEGIIKRIIADDGKPAVTDYEVIDELNGLSLIKLHPKTGRTHQIRLHLAHLGVPIYADFLYGKDIEGERIRLHCHSVSFPHPVTKKHMKITAPLPKDMELLEICKKL